MMRRSFFTIVLSIMAICMMACVDKDGTSSVDFSTEATESEITSAQKDIPESTPEDTPEVTPESEIEFTPESTPQITPEETPQPAAETVVDITALNAGDIISPEDVSQGPELFFQAYEIVEGDAVYNRINGRSYRENDHIGLSQLRYLKMLHYNFDHQIQVGEMIVNKAISQDVLDIFQELFLNEYEIQSMFLIDDFWQGNGAASDDASCAANNTSAFCYRDVTGNSSNLSKHALGLAIDVNPEQNPYVWYENGVKVCLDPKAAPYIDRSLGDPHMIVEGDLCCRLFKEHGFIWGGNWNSPIDYQHFEKR